MALSSWRYHWADRNRRLLGAVCPQDSLDGLDSLHGELDCQLRGRTSSGELGGFRPLSSPSFDRAWPNRLRAVSGAHFRISRFGIPISEGARP